LGGLLILIALGVGALWTITVYNGFVRSKNLVSAAWSDIDVQLQRRHDLIPQLVEAVGAYAGYERATLKAVAELRAQSASTESVARKGELEREIEAGVHSMIALAEDYPDLKASRNFLELQIELTEIEDHLQYARRFYNGAVRQLNTRIASFPDLLVARVFRFGGAEFFEAASGAEAPVRVRLA